MIDPPSRLHPIVGAPPREGVGESDYGSICYRVEKDIHDFFNFAIRKTRFSKGSHFQWLTATKMAVALYRTLPTEKCNFSCGSELSAPGTGIYP